LGWKFEAEPVKGRKDDRTYVDPERLRKNVENFRKRNPLLVSLMQTNFRESYQVFLRNRAATGSETK
jgi:hypothetical protein